VSEHRSGPVIRNATDADLQSIVEHYGPGGGDSPWDPFADACRFIPLNTFVILGGDEDGPRVNFGCEGPGPNYHRLPVAISSGLDGQRRIRFFATDFASSSESESSD